MAVTQHSPTVMAPKGVDHTLHNHRHGLFVLLGKAAAPATFRTFRLQKSLLVLQDTFFEGLETSTDSTDFSQTSCFSLNSLKFFKTL